jgi:hypothetical protein
VVRQILADRRAERWRRRAGRPAAAGRAAAGRSAAAVKPSDRA